MGHTTAEKLKDLKSELDQIRQLDGLREKGVGIFYYKSIPFVHFHDKDGERWADAKSCGKWVEVPISFGPSEKERQRLIRQISIAYKLISGKNK